MKVSVRSFKVRDDDIVGQSVMRGEYNNNHRSTFYIPQAHAEAVVNCSIDLENAMPRICANFYP